jgi:hypothetical protein
MSTWARSAFPLLQGSACPSAGQSIPLLLKCLPTFTACLLLSWPSHAIIFPFILRLLLLIGYTQCCGSGSGIRCLFDPWIRIPGWEKNQVTDPG